MKKNKLTKFIIAFLLPVLLLFVALSIGSNRAFADDSENKAYVATKVEADSSGLIYVTFYAEGTVNDTVTVYYHTEGGNAIPSVDYNTVTSGSTVITIGSNHTGSADIAIKCLNTADNRQIFKFKDSSSNEYGRYFNVVLDSAKNATVDTTRNTCQCLLSYTLNNDITVGSSVSYISDYNNMIYKYASGDSGLDGGDNYKTWRDDNIYFESDTTKSWITKYLNTGLASTYGSFVINSFDNTDWYNYSDTDMELYFGSKQFMSNYKRTNSVGNGLLLRIDTEQKKSHDDRITQRAMYLIARGNNPSSEDSSYVKVTNFYNTTSSETREIYFVNQESGWYANKGATTYNTFYKLQPYNGVLDMGVACHNRNSEYDIEIERIWMFMTCYDSTAPVITSSYVDDSTITEDGCVRIYVRYSEPVYSKKKLPLYTSVNNSSSRIDATYESGNYTDTLVYKLQVPKTQIDSIKYQLPSNDVGDLAYVLNSYGVVNNNMVQSTSVDHTTVMLNGSINYKSPTVTADISSNTKYDVVQTVNVSTGLTAGTIYYTWSNSSSLGTNDEIKNYQTYENTYVLTEEDSGAKEFTISAIENGEIKTGPYYLHVLVVNKYGWSEYAKSTNMIRVQTFGPYNLDGDPPTVVQNELETNELKFKVYSLDAKDYSHVVVTPSSIGKLYIKNADDTYSQVTDTSYTFDGATTYYTRTGSGTTENPYVYTVATATTLELFTYANSTFTKSNSTDEIIPAGTYYQAVTAYASGISEITLNLKYTDSDGNSQTESIILMSDGGISTDYSKIFKASSVYENRYFYYSNLDESTKDDYPIDTVVKELIGDESRITVEAYFTVSDAAGNTSVSNSYKITYDIRDSFDIEQEFDTNATEITDINTNYKAYNIGDNTTQITITIAASDRNLITTGNTFDGTTVYYTYADSTYTEATAKSLSLYTLSGETYTLSTDTSSPIASATYYILSNNKYVEATPASLGLYVDGYVAQTSKTSPIAAGTYYIYNGTAYEEATPVSLGLYTAANVAATATSFDGTTVYYTNSAATTIATAKDLKLYASGKTAATETTTFKVKLGDVVYEAESTNKYSITISGLDSGFYTLVPSIASDNTSSPFNFVADTIYFYLTANFNDETANYETVNSNLVLSNEVFQLDDVLYYYLDDGGSTIKSHAYGATYDESVSKYTGGSSYPTFSSVVEAKKYVKYMEYQDLYLISITSTMASLLNSSAGTTVYVKASGEEMVAQEGQLWIRYKKSTWTTSSTSYGWAFYYYGEGSVDAGINVNKLSVNLMRAMTSVVNKITSAGSTIYLVTDDTISQKTGAPYLASAQIHVTEEIATESKMGSKYVTSLSYAGDSAIYKNTVTLSNNNTYPLATNLELAVNSGTVLYYRLFETTTWYKFTPTDGAYLSAYFKNQVSGIYEIREYDDNGISQFAIYYDATAPTLNIKLSDKSFELNGTVLNYSGRTCSFVSMTNGENASEIDSQAYVAIYSYPSKKLQKVLYAADIPGYELASGNYYIQVGDRSGNIYTYKILLAETSLDVTITENESSNSLVVKVSNRDTDEIYSYEVYLNEVVVSSTLPDSLTETFKDAGIYKVVVTDIYGETVTKTYNFAFKSPTIKWYYFNDNESYTAYDETNIVKLKLVDDENSSKITNVYTASKVRLQFDVSYSDGTVKYEFSDGFTNYTYNSSTEIITINELCGFTLRVWFESYPENDHIYNCIVDNEAPNVSASFIGTLYKFDEPADSLNLEAYELGTVVSLNTLAYTKTESQKLTFSNGAIISGKNICLGLADPTGIKSYTVTIDGTVVQVELNDEKQLILNKTGYYVVTVIDTLGNTTVFKFYNISDYISHALVDSIEIDDDENTYYGNTDFVMNNDFNGDTTFIITVEGTSKTYVLRYDGTGVTICYYKVVEDVSDEDSTSTKNIAELTAETGYSISTSADKFTYDKYYEIITTDNYIIYAKITSEGKVSYKIAIVEKDLKIQALFNSGNTKLPEYYKAELSKSAPSLILISDNEEVTIVENSKYIYISGELSIKNEIASTVSKITIAYNQLTPTFTTETTIFELNDFTSDYQAPYKDDGFYQIIVTNVYNNKTTYIINKVDTFTSSVTVTYEDGTTNVYGTTKNTIYSNSKIELTIYNENVTFKINDVEFAGEANDSKTTYTFSEKGTYAVRATISNGLYVDYTFEIGSDDEYVFQESWITGYNDKALLKDKGYTNQLLTINSDLVNNGTKYISITFNDNENSKVLYDTLTYNANVTDTSVFANSIGKLGNGTYLISFRNQYGDITTKTIYYSTTPTLTLERKTVSNSSYETYDIKKAVSDGFYSNYILAFSTESTNYQFKINNESVSLEEMKTLEFNNSSGNGSFEYTIYYLDEYGNEITFKAILKRADVAINTSSMDVVTIDEKLYTKSSIKIEFADDLTGEVSVNGEDPVAYTSGKSFYKDGTYIFTVEDIAGNQNVYTIIHKSVVGYKLFNGSTGSEIINGSVINDASVTFNNDSDSTAYIKSVFRNSNQISDFSSNSFSTTGHWEIMVSDILGNLSYSEFYIIKNSLEKFSYNAPYGYTISEVWYTNASGTRTLTELKGDSIELTENGDYAVIVNGKELTSSFNFTITIDNTPPQATLVGVENGGTTPYDVTISNLKNGDIVTIYKDGVLIDTIDYSTAASAPVISEGGDYRIVITNARGVTIEYTFTRKKIANTAASVLIIIACLALIGGVTIGLVYHTKLKTDK